MADIGIPASLLERYFSAYSNRSPLEAAITPEKVQNALAAIGQFQDTRKAQANQALLQAARPEGSGNIPIQSFEQLMKLKQQEAEQEKQGQEQFNKTREKVFGWNKERLKQEADDKKAAQEWAFKQRRQAEAERHNRAMEKKKETPDLWGDSGQQPPGAGGGVAPTISPQDKAAFEWAKSNPNDPRATGIMLKLKQKGL